MRYAVPGDSTVSRTTDRLKSACSAALARSLHEAGLHGRLPGTRDAILTYHAVGDPGRYGNVSVERLRRDIEYLCRHYQVVDLPAVLEPSDEKRIALAFDDGYECFFHEVLPVLEAFEVPATLFVPVGFVGQSRPEFAYRFFRLPAEVPSFNDIEANADIEAPAPGVMSWTQLQAVADNPLVTIGNHTLTHPDLESVTDQTTLEFEVRTAQTRLREELDVVVDRFSYPFGRYTESARALVAETHDCAVTSTPGLVESPRATERYTLPRIRTHLPVAEVRWELTDLRWWLGSRT
jgi:peptidoglycan/xylan/chitin deacetylase (PgdA/CDA1 family)